jgi:predicted kinase
MPSRITFGLSDLVRMLDGDNILVIMVGYSASGKSTVVERLNKEAHYSCVRWEDIVRAQQKKFRETGDLRWLHRLVTWLRMVKLAAGRVKRKPRVVIDWMNLGHAERDELVRIAERQGYSVVRVWMKTSVRTCRERWKRRNGFYPHPSYFKTMEIMLDEPDPTEGISLILSPSGRPYNYYLTVGGFDCPVRWDRDAFLPEG